MTADRFCRFLVLVPTMVLAGCGTAMKNSPTVRSWETLSREECQVHDYASAYYLVHRLRPSWLSGRRAGSYGLDQLSIGESQIQVYVDGILSSTGVGRLWALPGQEVQEIQYLSPIDASIRFGTDHGAGAILVTTRVGRRNREI